MIKKENEKKKAIALRQQGKTYGEILEVVGVSKSSLSLWLKEVGLAKTQKQRLTKMRKAAQLRGGQARRNKRIADTQDMFRIAAQELGHVSKRDLFILGIALYWGEGTKEKAYRPSERFCFTNSDPNMIQIFIKWIRTFMNVQETDIIFDIHVHENHKNRIKELQAYWLEITKLRPENLGSTVYKKQNPKTVRKNTSDPYKGLVAIKVRRSTMLNRRVQGLINAFVATI
jgi:hypothetical protein